MLKRILTTGLILAGLLPAQALALPVATLTGPSNGDCLGGSAHPVKGTAAGDFTTLTWNFTLRRDDNGAVLQTRSGSQPAPLPGSNDLTNIDTTSLPSTALRMELSVRDSTGEATATRVFTPVYDRTKPDPVNVTSVYAKSYRQVWVGLSNARDTGCSGGVGAYTVFTGGTGLGGTPNVDTHTVINGSDHELLSAPVLNGGTVLVQAYATDKTGVEGTPGLAQSVVLPTNLDTVLAGQVKHTGSPVVHGLRVGTGNNKTVTDAGGWYRVGLNSSSSYNVTYGWTAGDPCTFPAFWCSTLAPVTDSLTTPIDTAVIVPRHRVMP